MKKTLLALALIMAGQAFAQTAVTTPGTAVPLTFPPASTGATTPQVSAPVTTGLYTVIPVVVLFSPSAVVTLRQAVQNEQYALETRTRIGAQLAQAEVKLYTVALQSAYNAALTAAGTTTNATEAAELNALATAITQLPSTADGYAALTTAVGSIQAAGGSSVAAAVTAAAVPAKLAALTPLVNQWNAVTKAELQARDVLTAQVAKAQAAQASASAPTAEQLQIAKENALSANGALNAARTQLAATQKSVNVALASLRTEYTQLSGAVTKAAQQVAYAQRAYDTLVRYTKATDAQRATALAKLNDAKSTYDTAKAALAGFAYESKTSAARQPLMEATAAVSLAETAARSAQLKLTQLQAAANAQAEATKLLATATATLAKATPSLDNLISVIDTQVSIVQRTPVKALTAGALSAQ